MSNRTFIARTASLALVWGGVSVGGLLVLIYLTAPGLLLGVLGKDETLTGRTDIWVELLRAIEQKPALGYGYLAFWGLESEPRYWLQRAVERTGKPVLVSMRRAQRDALPYNVANAERLAFLVCPEGYPTPASAFALEAWDFTDDWDDINCEVVPASFVGISSHCLAPELPIAAVARGCKLIEMHVQLDDEPSALEANVSLTITQFRDMVQAVRRTEEMLG